MSLRNRTDTRSRLTLLAAPQRPQPAPGRLVAALDHLAVRTTEAAELLGVSAATVKRMMADGEIPSVKLRGSRRVPRRALEAWLEEIAGGTR